MKVVFNEEDIEAMKAILNGLTVMGVQNCRQVAVIAQLLESGIPVDVKKEGE